MKKLLLFLTLLYTGISLCKKPETIVYIDEEEMFKVTTHKTKNVWLEWSNNRVVLELKWESLRGYLMRSTLNLAILERNYLLNKITKEELEKKKADFLTELQTQKEFLIKEVNETVKKEEELMAKYAQVVICLRIKHKAKQCITLKEYLLTAEHKAQIAIDITHEAIQRLNQETYSLNPNYYENLPNQ